MLYQLHWQFEDGTTEMKAQNEINSIVELEEWKIDVEERCPLPEGACWFVCGKKSKHFVMATAE